MLNQTSDTSPADIISAKELRLFETIPGTNVLVNVDAPYFTIIAATNEFVKVAGVERSDMVGQSLLKLFPSHANDAHASGAAGLRHSLDQVILTGRPHHLAAQEYDLENDEGDVATRFWDADNTPYINDDGRVIAIVHSTVEVTELVRAKQIEEKSKRHQSVELALQNSNERFQAAIQSIQGFLWTNSAEGRMMGEQKGWAELTGQLYDDYQDYGWANAVHPEDAQPTIDAWNEAVREKRMFTFEHRVKTKNGTYGIFTVKAIPLLTKDGSVREWVGVHTDNTEQRKIEREIRESEERFRKLADDSPIFVFIIRPDDSAPVSYWNKTWLQYTGQNEKEAQDIAWNDVVHPDDLSEVLTRYESSFKKQEAYFLPAVRIKRFDGVYRWHSFKGTPRYAADGTFNGYVGVGFDTHEQKLSEQVLRQSEAELQKRVIERTIDLEQQKVFIASILEASLNGICALKAVRNSNGQITDFEILFANHNIAEMLSVSIDQLIGKSLFELFSVEKANDFLALFSQIINSDKVHRAETHFVYGSIDSWFDYVVVPTNEETLVVTAKDITPDKLVSIQMEEQKNLLDSILKNSSNGISVSQIFRNSEGEVIDGMTILANDAAIKFTGLPKEEYLNRKATEIEPGIIGTPYYQAIINTLKTGEPFLIQHQIPITNRWLELTVSRLDSDHLIHVFTDVTPIKEAQLQIERTVEELQRSNQNLEAFAYAASHDLKEPIRKIHFFADLVKISLKERLTEQENDYFQRMETATKRMGTLIDDLLSYSQVNMVPRTGELVDLNNLIETVLVDIDLEIAAKKAIINVGKLGSINGHSRQLQQVFQNLITNALKYSKPGTPPEVDISCERVANEDVPQQLANESQSHVMISVKDNGIGFQQSDAERIFNVFTRLHGNAFYRGTGVGLSIVRKVVENHKGCIVATSKPDHGATFKIYLPE